MTESKDKKDKRLALHDAARIGIADIEAGRYREFDTFDGLREFVEAMTEKPSNRTRDT